jgi:flagellar basal-body rod modification protein FlgD
MTISPTSGAAATSSSADPTGAISNLADGMGRDAFLQLLVTQLQHQDPTKPQDADQMVTQLAQFSSLEKLTQISTGIDAIGQLLLIQAQAPGNTQ